MRTLNKVEQSIRDIFHRVELERAHIPAFRVVKADGSGTTIVGLLEYAYGIDMLIVRNSQDQWVGRQTHSTFLGMDNPIVTFTNVEDIHRLNVRSELCDYVSPTQESLLRFEGRLRAVYGDRRATSKSYAHGTRMEPLQLLSLFDFDPEQLYFVPAPANSAELARLEITGLRAYGRALQSPLDIAICDEEALKVADNGIGSKSDDSFKIATWLAKYVKEQVDLCWKLLEQTDRNHGDFIKLQGQLEWWLTRKAPLVSRMGWLKDVNSTARNLELLRYELIGKYQHIVEAFKGSADAILAQYPDGELKTQELERHLHLVAFTSALLYGLFDRLGLNYLAEKHAETYRLYRSHMTDAGRQELARVIGHFPR